jgi:hypothetical protein
MNNCGVCGCEREVLVSGIAKNGAQLQPIPAKMVAQSPLGASVAVCEDNAECRAQVRTLQG